MTAEGALVNQAAATRSPSGITARCRVSGSSKISSKRSGRSAQASNPARVNNPLFPLPKHFHPGVHVKLEVVAGGNSEEKPGDDNGDSGGDDDQQRGKK